MRFLVVNRGSGPKCVPFSAHLVGFAGGKIGLYYGWVCGRFARWVKIILGVIGFDLCWFCATIIIFTVTISLLIN